MRRGLTAYTQRIYNVYASYTQRIHSIYIAYTQCILCVTSTLFDWHYMFSRFCYLLGHDKENGLFIVGPLKCGGYNTTFGGR